ncbi:FtsX-like permease family protein [Clavibacter michiganensis]|uniref:FtsX-like permease family protein n=1 Tax=Clavibacter michiganensis TaxID=28447 RepID=A0A251Y7Z9_9MICO|nr:FtsX-like permease family protein [Clavibacter michiganensis]OUE20394.1 FtsX-like permease family protein [Clavibacter michiganensis]
MIRLVVAELRHDLRLWIGSAVIAGAAAAILAIMAGIVSSALRLAGAGRISDADLEGVIGFTATPVLLSGITMVIVVGGAAELSVAAQRQDHARWQLAGMTPRRVRRTILGLLAVLAIAAAVAGIAVGAALTQPVFGWLTSRVPTLQGARASQDPLSAASVIVLITALMLLGGRRAARQASRVPPIAALRTPEDPRIRMTVLRWLVAASGGAAAIALGVGMQDLPLTGIGQNGLFVGLAMMVALAAIAPLAVRPVLRAWTALIPARGRPAWYLARHACAHRITQSTSAVVPLTLGIVLVGSATSVTDMFASAQSSLSGTPAAAPDREADLLLFGAPLVLTLIASAVSVFMTGRARDREFALVQAAGATPRLVRRAAVLEAVVYAGTAFLLGLVIVTVASVVVWDALRRTAPDTQLSVGAVPMLALLCAGLLGLLLATLGPTLVALRTSIPRAVSA